MTTAAGIRFHFCILLVIPEEGDTLQGEFVFVFVRHLIIVFLPHVDELVAVNEANELAGTGAGALGIRRKGATCDEQSNIACTKNTQ